MTFLFFKHVVTLSFRYLPWTKRPVIIVQFAC